MGQQVMQQVQWELFYLEFIKTEDFDRTKRGYLVLVQYCDVKEDFKSNENRKRSTTDHGSSLEFQKFRSFQCMFPIYIEPLFWAPSRTLRRITFHVKFMIVFMNVSTNDFIRSRHVDLNRLEVLDYEEFYKWFPSSLEFWDYEKFNWDYD